MAQTSTVFPASAQTFSRAASGGGSLVDEGVAAAPQIPTSNALSRFFRGLAHRYLASLPRGSLTVTDASGVTRIGRESAHEIAAEIEVRDPRFYRLAVLGGGLGFAEAYLRGYWRTSDLVAVIRFFARNRDALENVGRGVPLLTWPLGKLTQFLQRNTKRGSRRNIMAHYDLGNDFFQLFLDPTMTYSSGVFERPESTMEEASRAKYDRICRKLELNRNDHVVEIGTGWGGFAIHAARNYGCRVTSTTISPSQYEYARQRIAEQGLADRIEVVLRDYRELTGEYDKLVSIEMIEAVGHEFLPVYFRKCSDLLKPDGMMAIQAITIPDQRYERYRKSVDFIQQYVFPGGCLPSLGAICSSVRKATDLRVTHLEDFGQHYAHTLAQWRSRFFENIAAVRRLGLDDRFIRCWEYYLCYCEGGFAERQIGVAQIVLNKPNSRHQAILPALA
jgi:cyclopropane-fatty-acyl-phospholipid synthase